MLKKNTTRINCIEAQSAEEFMSKMNSAFARYDRKGISYTYETNIASGYKAFIFYQETIDVPESIAEEFAQSGEHHTCGECPYFKRPEDKRRKFVRCETGKCLCREDGSCCEDFYEWLFNGEIELVSEVSSDD